MSLRVLHILDHSIPLQSGYAFRTRAILREQRRMGWDTFQMTGPKHTAANGPVEEVDGITFYRTPWEPSRLSDLPVIREVAMMRATTRRLRQVARLVRPDVLHAHSPALNAIPALRVGRRFGIPVVYEVRAFWEDAAADHGTSPEGGLRYRATRALETYALRRAAHVTTICEGLRKEIASRGISESKITVIPNAVDVGAFGFATEPDRALSAKLGLSGHTVIGFIGSYYAYEGIDLLLTAMPHVLQRLPDVRVLLVGGGPQEHALMALAERLGIRDKIVFAGRVPHSEVQRYYSVVDVFAYPRYSMRLTDLVTPLKPLEAMAQGRLLIASDVGGHRELIHDGETGVLFRAGDPASLSEAILRLLAERDRWGEMRVRSRRFIEQERNWAASVAGYRDVFKRLALDPR